VWYGRGRLYIADSFTVRKVNPLTDWLTTPAGNSGAGPFVGRVPATGAYLETCSAVADHAGNLVIADESNYRVRVVAARTGTFYGQAMTAGDIYSVVGGGTAGNGGLATKAFVDPAGVTVDGAGNLLITDPNLGQVRVVAVRRGRFYGRAMSAGDIYAVAGGGTSGLGDGGPAAKARLESPAGVAVDRAGNLVVADAQENRVRVVAVRSGRSYGQAMTADDIYTVVGGSALGLGDHGPATKAELSHPTEVAVDASGNLVIADSYSGRVRVAAASTGTFYGQAMTAGDIYTVAGGGNSGLANGVPAAQAVFYDPTGVAVDGSGNLVIADRTNPAVWVAAASTGTFYGQAMTAGDIYTVAGSGIGDGLPAVRANLDPRDVVVDRAGNLVIADGSYRIRVAAASTGTFYGQAMTAGDIYTVAGNGFARFSGDRGPAVRASLWAPWGVALDATGNLVIADTGNERIRVAAASTGTFYGQAMTAGDIYTVAGNGTRGFSEDGGLALNAELAWPMGVSVDHAGNLVISEYLNQRIRVVAASTGTFYGQAMTAGDIYTVAGNGTTGFSGDGGPATQAELHGPRSITVDAAGNLVIADEANNRVRVLAGSTGRFDGRTMTAGDIYTVAGNGTTGISGDGGPAIRAEMRAPCGVAFDAAGNLVIADTGGGRVRVVAARTGTLYGRAMTAGDIYTVAGSLNWGFSGDGGPATKAELNQPFSVAVDGQGHLIIADEANNRVRVVTG
jgi:sugar lactone lactonase YvrE